MVLVFRNWVGVFLAQLDGDDIEKADAHGSYGTKQPPLTFFFISLQAHPIRSTLNLQNPHPQKPPYYPADTVSKFAVAGEIFYTRMVAGRGQKW
jgi:hypothetical protein